MPKTWSNREIDLIDLRRQDKRSMPFTGWMIIVMAVAALGVYTFLAVDCCMHPLSAHANPVTPIIRTQ